jgi:hypothetical protein
MVMSIAKNPSMQEKTNVVILTLTFIEHSNLLTLFLEAKINYR